MFEKFSFLSWITVSGLVIALSASQTDAAVVAGPISRNGSSGTYYAVSATTWTDARSQGGALGGDLVKIDDAAEDEWLGDTFTDTQRPNELFWIGLNDAVEETTFRWTDGSVVQSGSPPQTSAYMNPLAQSLIPFLNALDSTYDYAWLTFNVGSPTGTNWGIDDVGATHAFSGVGARFGIIEVAVPEPASLAALAGIGVTVTRRRRWRSAGIQLAAAGLATGVVSSVAAAVPI